ncbi:MAG: phage tail assembly protein [Eubacterium sp.]|nr:phage tail assembly protein [Eubacterium sp.]
MAKDELLTNEDDNLEIVESTSEKQDEPVEVILKFKKPFVFEGVTYNEIDLSALENITGEDMIQVNRRLTADGCAPLLQEMSLEYAQMMAAQVTGMPIELFKALPAKASMKLKNIVTNFIYGEE